jgi:hypothetical protein
MEEFCENCVCEINQRMCRGCHILMKSNKAAYSNFMPTEIALKKDKESIELNKPGKDSIALVKRMIQARFAEDTRIVLCERLDEAFDLWKVY